MLSPKIHRKTMFPTMCWMPPCMNMLVRRVHSFSPANRSSGVAPKSQTPISKPINPKICKKRLVQSDVKKFDGIPTATKAVMHNNLDDTDTTLEILEYEYNVAIGESRFTLRGFYR